MIKKYLNMKNSILLLLAIVFTFSCSKEEDYEESDIVGTWKISQALLDPGDGSGVFTDIESDKSLEFFDDGRVISVGDLCPLSSSSEGTAEGLYDESTGKITADCQGQEVSYDYEIINNELILTYQCIEPCAIKYVKI